MNEADKIIQELEHNKVDAAMLNKQTEIHKQGLIDMVNNVWAKEIESGQYNNPQPIKDSKSKRIKKFFKKIGKTLQWS